MVDGKEGLEGRGDKQTGSAWELTNFAHHLQRKSCVLFYRDNGALLIELFYIIVHMLTQILTTTASSTSSPSPPLPLHTHPEPL